jgi:Txe/YoeB family toxin of toxin-antitoxin system
MWHIKYTKQADKDALKLKAANLKEITQELLTIITNNPYCAQPPYEKLRGDLQGYYSRRINVKHRLVYKVDKDIHIITIIRMWTHYE